MAGEVWRHGCVHDQPDKDAGGRKPAPNRRPQHVGQSAQGGAWEKWRGDQLSGRRARRFAVGQRQDPLGNTNSACWAVDGRDGGGAPRGLHRCGLSVARQGISCMPETGAFDVSATCFCYSPGLYDKAKRTANLSTRLTNQRITCKFGLCFMYQRNGKGHLWCHKRAYPAASLLRTFNAR
ncbi:MAG: hypothetical protein ACI807_003967 [Paracoccaceae bacterium]|jgi:hypothetical protein